MHSQIADQNLAVNARHFACLHSGSARAAAGNPVLRSPARRRRLNHSQSDDDTWTGHEARSNLAVAYVNLQPTAAYCTLSTGLRRGLTNWRLCASNASESRPSIACSKCDLTLAERSCIAGGGSVSVCQTEGDHGWHGLQAERQQ